jgi:hypothetical protein
VDSSLPLALLDQRVVALAAVETVLVLGHEDAGPAGWRRALHPLALDLVVLADLQSHGAG